MSTFLLLLVAVAVLVPSVACYCASLGANPGFRGPPTVEQVTLTSVQVTWAGLVTRKECADQFIVKSWLARNPNNYQMSNLLPTTQFSFIVTDLVPNQDYVLEVLIKSDLLDSLYYTELQLQRVTSPDKF